jgi:hypothetical protein
MKCPRCRAEMEPGNLLTPHLPATTERNTLGWIPLSQDTSSDSPERQRESIGPHGSRLSLRSNAYLPSLLCRSCGMVVASYGSRGSEELRITSTNAMPRPSEAIKVCPICRRRMEQGFLVANLTKAVSPGRHWRWTPPDVTSDVWLSRSEEIGEALPAIDFLVHGARKDGARCTSCEILLLDFKPSRRLP